jgi:hypothetical protein
MIAGKVMLIILVGPPFIQHIIKIMADATDEENPYINKEIDPYGVSSPQLGILRHRTMSIKATI